MKYLGLVAEVLCGLFALLVVFIMACACQINIQESPIDGVPQGSSYTGNAIGNPEWVAHHPRLAQTISRSSVLSAMSWVVIWPSALLYMTGYYTIPLLGMAFLAWRSWVSRRSRVHAVLLLLAMGILGATLPFLKACVIVMMD